MEYIMKDSEIVSLVSMEFVWYVLVQMFFAFIILYYIKGYKEGKENG